MTLQFTPRHSRLKRRFPNQIRCYRLKVGLSQAALAELVGVGANTISAWERGLSCPVGSYLLKMAKALSTLAEAIYPDFYMPTDRGGRRTDAKQ